MKASDSPESREPGGFIYHYNREERVSKLPEQIRDRLAGKLPGGIFKRNRSLLITLSNLVVIAFVWFVLLPLLRTPSSGVIEGYRFSLESFSYEGKALISLKAVAVGKEPAAVSGYTARFSELPGKGSVEAHGSLSADPRSPQLLRASLPLASGAREVECVVSVGAKRLSLKTRIRGE